MGDILFMSELSLLKVCWHHVPSSQTLESVALFLHKTVQCRITVFITLYQKHSETERVSFLMFYCFSVSEYGSFFCGSFNFQTLSIL